MNRQTYRAYYDSPFGLLAYDCNHHAVIGLRVVTHRDGDDVHTPLSDQAHAQIEQYLAGSRRTFDFPVELAGTPFQLLVWQALCRIPYGETRTYGELAAVLGRPSASRAVGMANSRNPLWIAVPCHRVIGAGGRLTGYAGGMAMKEALLALEREDRISPPA